MSDLGSLPYAGHQCEDAAVVVGPAGALDAGGYLEELAQVFGGEQALGEFGFAAGLGDRWGVRLDEADVLTGQVDGVAVDDADLIALDRLRACDRASQSEKTCKEERLLGMNTWSTGPPPLPLGAHARSIVTRQGRNRAAGSGSRRRR